jgi:predicted RNA-binding Zn-ribbon protein involved in translation (DUF1610 family)
VPQIGAGIWKSALAFFWWREYEDGRQEQEYDPLAGQIMPWGPKTPDGLKRAGWLPVSADLANKMKQQGEFGIPNAAPAVIIPVNPGEELIIYKEVTVWEGSRVHCKVCGAVFRSKGAVTACPSCGAKPAWRCTVCNKLSDTEFCQDCRKPFEFQEVGQIINPLESWPEKWDEVEYFLGVKGKFVNRFTQARLITEH